MLRQAVAGYERTVGSTDWNTFWGYRHLCRVLELRGRIPEAREIAADTLERIGRVYGVVHGQSRNRLNEVTRLLYLERNATGLRDFAEAWIRRVLDAPGEPSQWARGCRAAMLRTLAIALATLPQPVPYDQDLALRAAEEAVALAPQDRTGWATLGIVRVRLGRLEAAREALRHAEHLTPGNEGDGFLRFGESLTALALGDRAAASHALGRAAAAQAEVERTAKADNLTPVILRELRREVSARLGLDPTSPPPRAAGPPRDT